MQIILTESNVAFSAGGVFVSAQAKNETEQTTILKFCNGTSLNDDCVVVDAQPGESTLTSLGGLPTNNGLYVDIGACSSVTVEFQ